MYLLRYLSWIKGAVRFTNCHLVDRDFSLSVAKSDAKNLENDTSNMLTSPKLAVTNLGLIGGPFICLKLCPVNFFHSMAKLTAYKDTWWRREKVNPCITFKFTNITNTHLSTIVLQPWHSSTVTAPTKSLLLAQEQQWKPPFTWGKR